MSLYLTWLANRVTELGGRLERCSAPLSSFAQLRSSTASLVVNCTGLGARQLVGDNTVLPLRGQVGCTTSSTWTNFNPLLKICSLSVIHSYCYHLVATANQTKAYLEGVAGGGAVGEDGAVRGRGVRDPGPELGDGGRHPAVQ